VEVAQRVLVREDRLRLPSAPAFALLDPHLRIVGEGERGRLGAAPLLDLDQSLTELGLGVLAGDAVPFSANRLHDLATVSVGVLDPIDDAPLAVIRDDGRAPRHGPPLSRGSVIAKATAARPARAPRAT